VKTPEERAALVRQQVYAKVHWGARDWEVLDWLEQRHEMVGAAAEALLADAHRARRKAVRSRALVMLIFCSVGLLAVIGFFALQYMSDRIWVGYGPIVITGFGVSCLGLIIRSVQRLLSGEHDGPVDE
jgi:hypothetical protein